MSHLHWWRPCFRDQRLTQDVDKFCQELKNVAPQVVIAPFVIAYYTYATYNKLVCRHTHTHTHHMLSKCMLLFVCM